MSTLRALTGQPLKAVASVLNNGNKSAWLTHNKLPICTLLLLRNGGSYSLKTPFEDG